MMDREEKLTAFALGLYVTAVLALAFMGILRFD